jgi:hypothetical protein
MQTHKEKVDLMKDANIQKADKALKTTKKKNMLTGWFRAMKWFRQLRQKTDLLKNNLEDMRKRQFLQKLRSRANVTKVFRGREKKLINEFNAKKQKRRFVAWRDMFLADKALLIRLRNLEGKYNRDSTKEAFDLIMKFAESKKVSNDNQKAITTKTLEDIMHSLIRKRY